MRVCLMSLVMVICLGTVNAQDRLSGRTFATRSEVLGRNGMIATSHPIASQIGIEILKKGGSAVDAAIAANAFLGLADPADCGVGGDLFAIVWDAKTKKLYGLNASGPSAEGLTLEYFKSKEMKQIPAYGPLAVSVPGCVEGWFQLHSRFGKLPVAQLLAPTITYAREGIAVPEAIADVNSRVQSSIEMMNIREFKELYMKSGRLPLKGEVFKNPDLANTLDIIAKKGKDGFYRGEIAAKIEKHIKSKGGFLAASDLARYQAEWVAPVSTNYKGFDVWELPPNGQGIAVLQMLNILESFDLGKYGFGSREHLHYLVEAKRLAFEDMAKYYGDPRHSTIPVEKLISKEYAAQRRKLIQPDKAGMFEPGIVSSSNNTVYLTAADKEGNMVSLIQSNFFVYGSREVPAGLGFVLQNRGAWFELSDEKHANSYAPGKRPFHTIIPAFITKEDKPFMSFGVMGGDMQTQGHVQIILNMIDFGMNLQEAGDAPRVNHNGTFPVRGNNNPGRINLESGFQFETIRELIKMGHNAAFELGFFGGYQAIMVREGVYYGASESRQDGQAAGY